MIPVSEPVIEEEDAQMVERAVRSGFVSSRGEFITRFESGFSSYCQARYGVAVCNGTAALHLALSALDIKKGDEVIIPDLTFIATANAVRYCQAKPVPVDSEASTWCIDPEKVSDAITKRTKAIIPVHLYGHPANLERILEITESAGIFVVEDAAEAHGAEIKGKRVGGIGDVGCFSFYGNKILTTGEGGMCVTNRPELEEKMRILRDHGMDPKRKYWHPYVGYNYRMTNLQAALGVAQLRKIDRILESKRKNAALYSRAFEASDLVTLPPEADWGKNVYWMYSILVNKGGQTARDRLIERLLEAKIESRPFFYLIHTQPPYKGSARRRTPVAANLSRRGVNLPSSPVLTENEITHVAETVVKILKS